MVKHYGWSQLRNYPCATDKESDIGDLSTAMHIGSGGVADVAESKPKHVPSKIWPAKLCSFSEFGQITTKLL